MLLCDDGFLGTASVTSFLANGYGLYNMAGNTPDSSTGHMGFRCARDAD
jgi:formylglycine-generating enzyme required for sulfatase activity